MSGDNPILVERRDGYHRIMLNRPQRLNAFTEPMHHALRSALDDAMADTNCRAIVLTGAGRAFCAGQDLGDRQTAPDGTPPDLGYTLSTFYNPLIRALRDLPIPIVAAVNGAAAGAGANIAFACDIVLAARSASFLQAFARIGLIPDSGGTWSLPRLVGPARARALAMLVEPLPAETAVEWGLIWKAVADEDLQTEADAIATRLAAGSSHGLAAVKQALNASSSNTLDQQLDLERDLQQACGRHPDYAEGVRAFTEKRKPVFGSRE